MVGAGIGAVKRSAVLLLALLGCGQTEPRSLIVPGLPDNIQWLAALAIGPGAQLRAATGIVPRGELSTAVVDTDEEIARWAVVGWTDAQLAPLDPPSAAELRSAALFLGDERHRPLPTPSWAARGRDQRLETSTVALGYPLTAAWVPPCPDIAAGGAIAEVRCFFCAAQAQQLGCRLEIAQDNCVIQDLSGEIAPDGRVRFSPNGDFTECVPTDLSAGLASALRCSPSRAGLNTCEILFSHGEAPTLFSSQSVQLFDAPFFSNREGRGTSHPFGYLSGLLETEEGSVVSAYGPVGPSSWGCPLYLPTVSDRPGRLYFANDALEIVATVTTAPCLTQLVPSKEGFFVIDGAPTQSLEIYRGHQRIGGHPLPLPEPGYAVIAVAATPARERIGVLYSPVTFSSLGYFASLNGTTGELEWMSGTIPLGLRTLVALDEHRFASTVYDEVSNITIDVRTQTISLNPRLPCRYSDTSVVGSAYDASTQTLVLASRMPAPRVFFTSLQRPECQGGLSLDEATEAYSISLGRGFGVAGLTSLQEDETAYVAPISVGERRILRGSAAVGRGPLTALAPVRGVPGDYLGILMAEAKLVRIRTGVPR